MCNASNRRWLWLKSLACYMPLVFWWDGVGPVAHYDVGHGIGEDILVVVKVKEALIVVMVLLHLMVVVIGVLRYMCVVQCLGSWTPSVALGILSDSTVTPSAVKISDLHIFHRWKSDVLNISDSSVQLVPCERLILHRDQYPLHQFTFCVIQPFVFWRFPWKLNFEIIPRNVK